MASLIESGRVSLSQTDVARWIPENVFEALTPRDQSGPNLAFLRTLSGLYQSRVDQRMTLMAGMVGPFGIVTLGIIVGFGAGIFAGCYVRVKEIR